MTLSVQKILAIIALVLVILSFAVGGYPFVAVAVILLALAMII